MNKLIAMFVVAVMVSAAVATVPNPPVRRLSEKVSGVYYQMSSMDHVNTGGMGALRAAKGYDRGGEHVIVDWENMATIQSGIDTELALWGKTLAQAMSLGMVTIRYEIGGYSGDADEPDKEVNLKTILSANDWHEGDGLDWDTMYDWTTPYAATWAYAGDTVPFSSNAIEWEDPTAGPGLNKIVVDMPGTINGSTIIGIFLSLDDNGTPGYQPDEVSWSGTELDEAFWQELIYEDNCVGLRQYGSGWEAPGDANTKCCTDDQWGGIAAPSLVIQVKPHDGDAQPDGFVDLLDLTIVANNWELNPGGNEWEQADFNSDGNVDLLDLTLLANEWEWAASGGAAAVPEPASLVVLCVGALALIRRRR